MILQLTLGGFLVLTNVIIHAVALDLIIRNFSLISACVQKYISFGHKPIMSAVCVTGVFVSHIVQIWIWAFAYMCLAEQNLSHFSEALYFSTTTMTTLGYGDIVLPYPWNTFSAIEAANGLITFGWSTAFTFEIISQLYKGEAKSIH